jgi:ABC-type lipopolysaccharide export system ATPase subunit
MSDATIEVSGLRKRFGATLALDGMTFTVSPGQVTGFIGPNGAGKSNIGQRHFFLGMPGLIRAASSLSLPTSRDRGCVASWGHG